MTTLRQTATVVAAAVVFALAALPASAAVVNLGGGWQASWDTSLDGLVDVIASELVGDTLFIEKSINFRQAPVNGIYSPVLVQFPACDSWSCRTDSGSADHSRIGPRSRGVVRRMVRAGSFLIRVLGRQQGWSLMSAATRRF